MENLKFMMEIQENYEMCYRFNSLNYTLFNTVIYYFQTPNMISLINIEIVFETLFYRNQKKNKEKNATG